MYIVYMFLFVVHCHIYHRKSLFYFCVSSLRQFLHAFFAQFNSVHFINLVIWFISCDVNIGLASDLLSIFSVFDNNGVYWRDRFNLIVLFSFYAKVRCGNFGTTKELETKQKKKRFFSRYLLMWSLELLFIIQYMNAKRWMVFRYVNRRAIWTCVN